jgi:peptidoglycan/LPS O-acetylase OafA/YrhL
MNSTLTKSETAALDYVRWLSTICIVVCHFQQGLGSKWAWVFNIGVQVFFFLSGFLYGVKGVADVKKFYRGRIVKLLIPYWIVVTAACIALLIFSPELVSRKAVFVQYTLLQFCSPCLPGLGHLWFIPGIFVCYLTLPLIDVAYNRNAKIGAVAFLALLIAFVVGYNRYRFLLWCPIYFVGYLCGRFPRLQAATWALAVLGLIATFVCLPGDCEYLSSKYISFHILGGIAICLGIFLILRQIPYLQRIRIGGYEVYLVHHILILGPLSLLFLTKAIWLNILIIIALIILLTYLLMKATKAVDKLLKL